MDNDIKSKLWNYTPDSITGILDTIREIHSELKTVENDKIELSLAGIRKDNFIDVSNVYFTLDREYREVSNISKWKMVRYRII